MAGAALCDAGWPSKAKLSLSYPCRSGNISRKKLVSEGGGRSALGSAAPEARSGRAPGHRHSARIRQRLRLTPHWHALSVRNESEAASLVSSNAFRDTLALLLPA